jgi:hypothetical protein
MATAPAIVPTIPRPPANDPPLLGDGQQHSESWSQYFQTVSDRLATLAAGKHGVTDGSDSAVGDIGEYLSATASGVGLATNVQANVVALTLTAGDWDVSANVTFHLSSAASTHYGAGIDALSQEIFATIPTGTATWRLAAAPVRRNVTASTVVHAVAIATFSAGGVNADGFIQARRAR